MASSMVSNSSMECSCSGRGVTKLNVILRRPRARTTVAHPAQASHKVSASTRSSPDHLSQPPFLPSYARRKQQPLRVVQERPELVPGLPDDELDREPVDIDYLNETWGIPGAIEFGVGQGDLPTVLLTHPQTGNQVVIYLYGATIAQWLKSDGTATFYDGPDALYQEGLPLRTGVSIHFPQHREGLLPEHGFADRMMWEVEGAGFDCPEYMDQLAGYFETLQQAEVVTPAQIEAMQAGDEEAEEAVRQALSDLPPPDGMVLSDMAPAITLRLRDTLETRRIWPHRFELRYKITLMAQEPLSRQDIRDLQASRGIDPDFAEMDDLADDEEILAQLEAEEAEAAAAGEGEAGDGEAEEDGLQEVAAGEAEEAEQVEVEDGEDELVAELDKPPAKRRGRPAKGQPAAEPAADDGGDDAGDVASGSVGAGEADAARVGDPITGSVQIKQEFWVVNRDDPDAEPMRFNLASLARFVTLQQPQYSDWVKVLGLGGSQTFDYTEDPRYPQLDLCEEDFLHFNGEPIDVTYVGAADATVYLCPGNRTHFEFVQRAGFRDMFVEQPAIADSPDFSRVAAIGTGYIATTKAINPGEQWFAESIIRFHERYWRLPIFGDDSMPPLAPMVQELLTEGVGEDEDAFDGLPSEPTAPAGPEGADE